MKIKGCRINFGKDAKKELFELLPKAIERMISKNKNQNFDFKMEVTIKGRLTSIIKTFGPDFLDDDLKGKTLEVSGNTKVTNFGLKFNNDGSLDIVKKENIPSNEGALPRQSTVDQLNKIRKSTKSVTIDNTTPKMKGHNLNSEKNYIDSGIESYEDYQKKNKSFTPSWNLKHLKSPFRNSSK